MHIYMKQMHTCICYMPICIGMHIHMHVAILLFVFPYIQRRGGDRPLQSHQYVMLMYFDIFIRCLSLIAFVILQVCYNLSDQMYMHSCDNSFVLNRQLKFFKHQNLFPVYICIGFDPSLTMGLAVSPKMMEPNKTMKLMPEEYCNLVLCKQNTLKYRII